MGDDGLTDAERREQAEQAERSSADRFNSPELADALAHRLTEGSLPRRELRPAG